MRLIKVFPFGRGLGIVVFLTIGYLLVTVGYYSIPWSIRQAVYHRAPSIDHALMVRGHGIVQGWDDLALFGRDVSVGMKQSFRGDQVYGGWPGQERRVFGRLRMLENRGYTVGYSDAMSNPLWVAYRIFDVPKLVSADRPSGFFVDTRTRAKVSHNDYTNSGLDRGHMAPNFGIGTRYGYEAQMETFLMSNIIPQTPRINRYLWKDLEMRVARRYGRYFREVWVITGPVFQGEIKKLASGVPVPSAYYKIIVDEHHGELRAMAFLVQRASPPYSRIKPCLTSIDEIETLTDLDFFPELPDDVEDKLESGKATRLWPTLRNALAYRLFGRTS